ncbi:MAG: hypothetical protein R3B45_09915 [Bdellovibrionota bacterium]
MHFSGLFGLNINAFFLLFLSFFLSCNGPDNTGFQQGEKDKAKVEKERNSASSSGTDEEDADAIPPEMISGAFLVCQWIDESAGQGGCALTDNSGVKIQKIATPVDWWSIAKRDGGEKVNTEFTVQAESNPYHTIFKTPAEVLAAKEQLDVVLTYPWGFKTYSLSNFFQPYEIPKIGKEGIQLTSVLGNLVIPNDKINLVEENHRSFYLWPDPNISRAEKNENASIVADSNNLNGQFFSIFNANAFCNGNGDVQPAIDDFWYNDLVRITQTMPYASGLNIRREVGKKQGPIDFLAQSYCILPLALQNGRKTSSSSDGKCMFMLIRETYSSSPLVPPQPYLAIFTSKFANAVGFTQQDMETAANEFSCSN